MSQNNNKKSLRRRKKKQTGPLVLVIAAGLLLLIGAIFAINKPTQSAGRIEVKGAPSIKVNQEVINMGDVKLGRTVEASFMITNVGDQVLRFTKAPYIEVLEGC